MHAFSAWNNEWHPLGRLSDFEESRLVPFGADSSGLPGPLVVLRTGEFLWAFHAHCTACGALLLETGAVSPQQVGCSCGQWTLALPVDPEAGDHQDSGVVPVMLVEDAAFVWLGAANDDAEG